MITIINTGIGNLKSIQNMLLRLGVPTLISDKSEEIMKATKLILPGVGSFDAGMEALNKLAVINAIKYKVLEEKTKILGICLGMQLLGDASEEGALPGLSLIKGCVKKFSFPNEAGRKLPHMGWNYAISQKSCLLLDGFEALPRFYFTHSYHFECKDETNIKATTPYGSEFCSVLQDDNIFGVQFHPEKSHRFGLHLMSNFVKC